MTQYPLHPLRDYVLVKRDEPKDKTQGGIVIGVKEAPPRTRGVVLAVGPGRVDDNGRTIPVSLTPGLEVIFRDNFAVQKETVEGVEYLLIPEADFIAVVAE